MKSLIKYGQLILLIILTTFTLFGQQYGNEWIDYSKTHYKFQSDDNGLHRISFDALSQSGIDLSGSAFKLITAGAEIPIYVSTNGIFGSSDYIEFYGTENDGSFDTQLYETPAFQPQPDKSLFDDTRSYFLVSDNSEPHLRFQNEQNDVSNFSSAEPYFMHESKSINANAYHFGEPFSGVVYQYPSTFDKGEGFVGSKIIAIDEVDGVPVPNIPFEYRINTEHLYPDAATEATAFFKIVGRNWSTAVIDDKHITIDIDGEVYIDTFSRKFDMNDYQFNFPLSKINNEVDILGEVRTVFNITAFDGVAFGFPYETEVSLCNASVIYPRSFDFDGHNDFLFNVDVPSSKYLEIENFDNSTDIVLYDLTANKRIIPVFENDQQRFAINADGTTNHKLFIANENATHTVENLTPKGFIDYYNTGNQGDYIILTHSSLIPGPDELAANDYVDDYNIYRESDEGGNHNVTVVEISELYDQFAQGIEQHPLSVKNFVDYSIDNWSTTPEYLNILGKGLRYDKTRKDQTLKDISLIPSYGHTASDNYFAIRNRMETPQLAIGRVPVKSREELAAYLAKVMVHESTQSDLCDNPQFEDWMNDVLYIARGWGQKQLEEFKEYLQEMTPQTEAANYEIVALLEDNDVAGVLPPVDAPEFATHLNNGLAMINFVGHGVAQSSYWQYGVETPENYNNQDKYPFIYANSEFVSRIHDLSESTCMAEDYVLAENRGAIAYMSKSTLTAIEIQQNFSVGLTDQIMTDNFGKSIGSSIINALNNIITPSSEQNFYNTIMQFDFVGDPAVKIHYLKNCNEEEGCTNPLACNYDPNATDNTNCDFGDLDCPDPCNIIYGCLDANDCLYNPDANCHLDAFCSPLVDTPCPDPCNEVYGCTNPEACNFDVDATCDDGSCDYQSCQIDLNLIIIADLDYVSVGEAVVFEITVLNEGQNTASNIQVNYLLPSAFIYILDDASIGDYNVSTGLWNVGSLSAGQSATLIIEVVVVEDGLHENVAEITSASPNDLDSTPGNNDISEDDQGSVSIEAFVGGSCCTDPSACNYDPACTNDDGSCEYGVTECPDPCNAILGCTDPIACNYDANANCDNNSCNNFLGCTDTAACNYDANATCDLGNCYYECDCCTDPLACNYIPECTTDTNCDFGVGQCPEPCYVFYGCTDPSFCNYDASATCDDGSCISDCSDFCCDDPTACNYSPDCNFTGGPCEYGDTECPDPCNAILGCTNPEACNYNANATCDDGSCDIIGPGCDDPTACNYDEEATCNDGTCLITGQQVGNSVVDANCQLVVIPNECIEDCVWPGDSNNDGVANNFDLFNIGWAFDATGTSRINASSDWSPQFSLNWQESFESGEDFKHADCDGDGSIYRDDIQVINDNYGNTVGKTDEFKSAGIPLNIIVSTDTIEVGAFLKIDFALGDSENIVDVYGVAFTLEYDPLYLKEENMEITFPNSWMGTVDNTISIHQNFPEDGKIDIAYSRTNQLSVLGSGTFGYAIVEIDNLDGKTDISEMFNLKLSNTLMMDGAQERFTLQESETTVLVVDNTPTSIIEINATEQNIDIYPNPASNVLNINCDDNIISSLRIYNTAGKILMEQYTNDKQLYLNQFTNGFYLVEITTEKGTFLKKLVVSK